MTIDQATKQSTGKSSFQASRLQASLTVTDLEKSVNWYQEVLGFTVAQRHEREGKLRAVAVQAGAVRLLLNQDDGARGWERVKGEGFSIQFITDQDIDEIARRIVASGGTLQTEPADMPWGARAFRLHDPDGYKFSVSSDPAASRG